MGRPYQTMKGRKTTFCMRKKLFSVLLLGVTPSFSYFLKTLVQRRNRKFSKRGSRCFFFPLIYYKTNCSKKEVKCTLWNARVPILVFFLFIYFIHGRLDGEAARNLTWRRFGDVFEEAISECAFTIHAAAKAGTQVGVTRSQLLPPRLRLIAEEIG